MGRIRFAAILILLSFGLVSCGGAAFSDYRAEDFYAEADYYLEGELLFSGIIEMGEDKDGAERDIRVTLTAPDAMAGVIIAQTEGRISVLLGEREMDGAAFSAIISGAELLVPSGEAIRVEKREVSGKKYVMAEFSSGEEIYFDPDTEMPVEIRRGAESISIRKISLKGKK